MECSTTGRASVMVEEGSSGLEGILCCTCASGFTVLKVPVVGEKMTGGSAAGEVCVIDCCRGAGGLGYLPCVQYLMTRFH